ncbi:hypothetical protein AALP_AA3G322200 [Arabis alpina]|uniref:Uncharacterized protein n=1 Tax=Arabis alpina TaxID=50452 RepID=A0A087HD39_ARAAL|nr:hypothetical protein AALP_AA3G322200 [Arabis alpina]
MVVIQQLELCIEMMKLAMELMVVVAEAVRVFLSYSTPPSPFLRHGFYIISPNL